MQVHEGRQSTFDVVVVGAGIAGCTAAILYARQGLSVLLLEAHRSASTFKRLCTHQIQSPAVGTLQRLGLLDDLEDAGARRSRVLLHVGPGWVQPPDDEPIGAYGYNIRRSVLDPFLRTAAAECSGVTALWSARVRELTSDGTTVTGVRYIVDGREQEAQSSLVVGADGRSSTVAVLAGLPARQSRHGRHSLFAHFRGSSMDSPLLRGDLDGRVFTSRLWLRDPGIVYTFPTDDDRVVVAAMMPPEVRSADRSEHDAQLRSIVAEAPDGPDLRDAERLSDVLGVREYPALRRRPVRPGVALVGDAASSTDYLWGIGCSWAFTGAEWLVDCTAEPLRRRRGVSVGLRRYARRRWRELRLHELWNDSYATGRPLRLVERTLLHGATVDPELARTTLAFGARAVGFTEFVNPINVGRGALALARARLDRGSGRTCVRETHS